MSEVRNERQNVSPSDAVIDAPPSTRITELCVNGAWLAVDVDGERSLLSVLRDRLDLTGTKYGCGERQCGACVVLIDGQPTPSCVTPVGAVQDRDIVTIEGLSQDGRLHPLQRAFLEVGAFQCGYCTPGMIMESVGLLAANSDPTVPEIIQAMDRHICRCGAYSRIVCAIQRAAAALRETQTSSDAS